MYYLWWKFLKINEYTCIKFHFPQQKWVPLNDRPVFFSRSRVDFLFGGMRNSGSDSCSAICLFALVLWKKTTLQFEWDMQSINIVFFIKRGGVNKKALLKRIWNPRSMHPGSVRSCEQFPAFLRFQKTSKQNHDMKRTDFPPCTHTHTKKTKSIPSTLPRV